MKTEILNLWNNIPGGHDGEIHITSYIPDEKKFDGAVVILPGGGYSMRAEHEGRGYAEFLADNGMVSFVVDYRVSPFEFPLPLLDSRRAIKFVRYYADKYGIDKSKIAVMGSSAGGHLAAMTSTYFEPVGYDDNCDAIDAEDFIPNAQILCYPVIYLYNDEIRHISSANNLLGNRVEEYAHKLTPIDIVSNKTPKAFIWHTFEDQSVHVYNSLDYAKALKKNNIPTELHIFPEGWHGMGLANDDANDKLKLHINQWGRLLVNWLDYIGF